jgi:hypothetical protein
MSGSTSILDAIVDIMMERLQKENPDVEYYKKSKRKKEDVSYQILKKMKKLPKSKLH